MQRKTIIVIIIIIIIDFQHSKKTMKKMLKLVNCLQTHIATKQRNCHIEYIAVEEIAE